MLHTNFSRNFYQTSKDYIDRLEKYIKFNPNDAVTNEYYTSYTEARELHNKAVKFLLPPGGQLLSHEDQGKIIKTTKRLNLPYPVICLEYSSSGGDDSELDQFLGYDSDNKPIFRPSTKISISSPKRLVYAYQTENSIFIHPVFFMTANDVGFGEKWWKAIPSVVISRNIESLLSEAGHYQMRGLQDLKTAKISDYSDELNALMSFLLALNCNNVEVTTSKAKKTNIKAKKGTKEPLSFDDYKILVIKINDLVKPLNKGQQLEYDRASPREHLRRGHIRHYQNGKTVWINSTVINKDKGGVITKSYLLK